MKIQTILSAIVVLLAVTCWISLRCSDIKPSDLSHWGYDCCIVTLTELRTLELLDFYSVLLEALENGCVTRISYILSSLVRAKSPENELSTINLHINSTTRLEKVLPDTSLGIFRYSKVPTGECNKK